MPEPDELTALNDIHRLLLIAGAYLRFGVARLSLRTPTAPAFAAHHRRREANRADLNSLIAAALAAYPIHDSSDEAPECAGGVQ